MAVDTRAKRASVVGTHYISGPGVTPDSDKDQAWRQAVGYGYYGILAEAPTVTPVWTAVAGPTAVGFIRIQDFAWEESGFGAAKDYAPIISSWGFWRWSATTPTVQLRSESSIKAGTQEP